MCEKCNCGKVHTTSVKTVVAESGAISKIPALIFETGAKRPFVLADTNTFKAAGEKVAKVLEENNIDYSKYVFEDANLEPDEGAVGSAVMHFDQKCDIVIAVGSGVINDIGKILAKTAKLTYMIVATAPSMDGYASASSSMAMDGLKISLSSKCPEIIVGDIDVIKKAPLKMLQSGLGDMLAKYISICEWRIANLLIGEYYCDYVADMVRTALKKCVDNAKGLLNREDEAVKTVFEGLVLGGMAMEYAGVSRPASGVEHYISHVWDMRGLEFGTNTSFHGIQCGIGTLIASRVYEQIKKVTPNREKALKYAKDFSVEKWNEELLEFIGKGAKSMIELDKKEQKYDLKKHEARLEIIIENWDTILCIIAEEVPSSAETENILDTVGAPKSCAEFGIDEKIVPETFKASKDIRDKYVLSRLCWDLGVLDEIAFD